MDIQDETERIVINLEDLQPTPRELEIQEVSQQVIAIAKDNLAKATDVAHFLLWHDAVAVFFTPSGIEWMWDQGGSTAEEIIRDQSSKTKEREYQKNAEAIQLLGTTIDSLPPQEGKIRMGIRRLRDKYGIYHYRVLAAIPEGIPVTDPLDTSATDRQRPGESILFLNPEQACVMHACDDVFKVHRNTAFYVTYMPAEEAIKKLRQGRKNLYEYQLAKTTDETIKQDPYLYILAALLGGFDNERLRTRVSDYWNRNR